MLLPGYPLLEARLNATSLAIAPFTKGKKGERPELHFLRALGWFRDAGLKEPTAQTFVGDVHVPLSDDIRSALMSLFQWHWGEPQSELTQEDWAKYQRLCQPESSDFILNLADYYAFLPIRCSVARSPNEPVRRDTNIKVLDAVFLYNYGHGSLTSYCNRPWRMAPRRASKL